MCKAVCVYISYYLMWLLFKFNHLLSVEGLPVEEYENKKMWLKHSCEPWPRVLELWGETSVNRRAEIMQNSDKGVGQIFKDWPRYKDTKGYSLVCVLHFNILSFLMTHFVMSH